MQYRIRIQNCASNQIIKAKIVCMLDVVMESVQLEKQDSPLPGPVLPDCSVRSSTWFGCILVSCVLETYALVRHYT